MSQPSPQSIEPRRIALWPKNSFLEIDASQDPFLEIFPALCPEKQVPATVLICPGGGYAGHSPYECLWAEFIRSLGMSAAVLHYRLSPCRYPAPYADLTRAIRLLKVNGPQWGLSTTHLALMGGSAGGHLAALGATRPGWYRDPADDLAESVSAHVERLILAYPVISAVQQWRHESLARILPPDLTALELESYSPELHITTKTPPTFLVHASNDNVVSVENSLLFARQCWLCGVSAELHIFPDEGHGRLFQNQPDIGWRWRSLLQQWLTLWTASMKTPL